MYNTAFELPQQAAPTVPGVAVVLRRLSSLMQREFGRFELIGEIHSIKTAMSGHVYFDLKDTQEDALLACALFRTQAQSLTFTPKVGDVVIVSGELNLYAPRGQISFVVRKMKLAGAGDLYAQFLALKEHLQALGFFDESRKKPLPRYPRRIGIVTSLRGAALQDVLKTIKQRAPFVHVVIYPTSVQGEAATDDMIRALRTADARREVGVLMLVRGGGSMADLWCFNAERLARCLAALSIPVVAGIGHESDVTIADLVADCRAATPTAAAVKVTEHWAAVVDRMESGIGRLTRAMRYRMAQAQLRVANVQRLQHDMRFRLQACRTRLETVGDIEAAVERFLLNADRRLEQAAGGLAREPDRLLQRARLSFETVRSRLALQQPRVETPRQRLDARMQAARRLLKGDVALKRERLKTLTARLRALDVHRVLDRGYALATDAQGRIVKDASQLSAGQRLTVRLAKGRAHSTIDSVTLDEPK